MKRHNRMSDRYREIQFGIAVANNEGNSQLELQLLSERSAILTNLGM